MITRRQAPLALASAARRHGFSGPRVCQQSRPAVAAWARSCQTSRVAAEPPDDLSHLEEEYGKLKVNWFPGHMVKATKIIREKLKQVWCDACMYTPAVLAKCVVDDPNGVSCCVLVYLRPSHTGRLRVEAVCGMIQQ